MNNHFIDKFKEELNKVENKEFLVQNEITQIEIFTSKRDDNYQFHSLTGTGGHIGNVTNSVFDLSDFGSINLINDTFHEYVLYGKLENFSKENYRHNEWFIETGKLLAEYYQWLKELKITKSKEQFSDLTNEQKLLALYFLCPDLINHTNNQLKKVISQILNIGPENIRKNLSKVYNGQNDVRSIENFEKLLELFENKTFESITNKIKREIKQMS